METESKNETVDGAGGNDGCGGRRLVVGLLERNRMTEYGGAVIAEMLMTVVGVCC